MNEEDVVIGSTVRINMSSYPSMESQIPAVYHGRLALVKSKHESLVSGFWIKFLDTGTTTTFNCIYFEEYIEYVFEGDALHIWLSSR